MSSIDHGQRIQDFISELSGFAQKAEDTLKGIEEDMQGRKADFAVFEEKMFTIRGTAQQLNLPHIAQIAGLGEEIAHKGVTAENNGQVRRCVGALWDALTTVKHLLQSRDQDTGMEQGILINRLEATLRAFGGARPTVSEDEIEKLLRERGKS